jgi:hypothetical protein
MGWVDRPLGERKVDSRGLLIAVIFGNCGGIDGDISAPSGVVAVAVNITDGRLPSARLLRRNKKKRKYLVEAEHGLLSFAQR